MRPRPTSWPARSWTQISKGSCAAYHANAPEAYFQTLKFWKTPAGAVRQRQERLRAVPAVGHRLDPDHRVAGTDRALSSMTTTAVREDRAVRAGARVSAALWRRAWLRATLTLSPPLAWFVVIYLASLAVMLVTAFWSVNPFTNSLVHTWTLANFQQIFSPTYLTIIARTIDHGGGRHGHRRHPRAAVRLLHGAGGDAARAAGAVHRRAARRCGRATWPGSTPGSSSCKRAAR